MHKIQTFTGTARHGWEKMTPSMGFGMSRPHPQQDLSIAPPSAKRSLAGSSMSPNPSVPGHPINLSFNVPFNSNLPGPDKDEVLYSSRNAYQKWTHPEGAGEDIPNHALPVHTRNVETLRGLCRQMSEIHGERLQATVTSSKPKPVPGMQRGPLTALVTNVCISGDSDVVHKLRAQILKDTPITLVSSIMTLRRANLADSEVAL